MSRFLGTLLLLLVASDAFAHGFPDPRRMLSPSHDLEMPASWAGQWQITTTIRRGDTDAVAAIDDVTDVIRAGEPLGASRLTRGGLASCFGAVGQRRLELACWRTFTADRCLLAGWLEIVIDRTGDTLEGSGKTLGYAIGRCGPLPHGAIRTTFDLEGRRLSPNQGGPGAPATPLLARFVASVPLLTRALTLRQVKPVIVDDCKDGGWRNFEALAFRNQGQCIKFVLEEFRDKHHLPASGKDGGR